MIKLRAKSEVVITSVNSVLRVKQPLKFEQPGAIKQRLLKKSKSWRRD